MLNEKAIASPCRRRRGRRLHRVLMSASSIGADSSDCFEGENRNDSVDKSKFMYVRGGSRQQQQDEHEDINRPVTKKELQSKQLEAVASIRSCYRTVLATAVIDIATDGWALREATRVQRLLEVLTVAWKIGLTNGLYGISEAMSKRTVDITPENVGSIVDDLYRIMGRLWRQTAQLITLASMLDLATLFRQRVSLIPQLFAASAVLASFLVQAYSIHQTDEMFMVPSWMRRKMKKCRKSDSITGAEKNGHDALTNQGKVAILARNMALVSAALVMRAVVVIPLLSLGQPNFMALATTLIGIPTPFVTGGLVWKLRTSQLENYGAILANEWKPSLQVHVFEAQRKFYKRVKNTLQTEGVIKLLATVVPPLVIAVKSKLSLAKAI